MVRRSIAAAAGAVLLAAGAAHAQALPAVPAELLGTSAVACLKVTPEGVVSDAFILTSTGDAEKDKAVLGWVRKLRWPRGEAREAFWSPLAVGFGGEPRDAPASCAPTA